MTEFFRDVRWRWSWRGHVFNGHLVDDTIWTADIFEGKIDIAEFQLIYKSINILS